MLYSPSMDGLELFQNYPNPFTNSTEIRYTIPSPGGHVLLRVFNTLGQEIRVLADEDEAGGQYKVRFDGTSFPSGQYTYTLVFTATEGGTVGKAIKKMYLVR